LLVAKIMDAAGGPEAELIAGLGFLLSRGASALFAHSH
jgi:hypothetical protein